MDTDIKKYLKDTAFTLLETALLLLLLLLLLKIFTNVFNSLQLTPLIILGGYFIMLIFILFLKRQLLRFRRWRILHFSLKRIDSMSGEDFERYLKYQFENLGFHVTFTKTSNDYGADLILQRKNLTIAVQVKRYQGSIGVKAVQEVIGSMAYYHAGKGLVVTNSVYTKNAEKLALANDVILWDRDVLIRLMSGENMAGYLAELTEHSHLLN